MQLRSVAYLGNYSVVNVPSCGRARCEHAAVSRAPSGARCARRTAVVEMSAMFGNVLGKWHLLHVRWCIVTIIYIHNNGRGHPEV